MKYSDYSVRDFIKDEYFQNWVFHPDEGTERFWQLWMKEHPEKIIEVQEAKRLLGALQFERHSLSPGEVTALWTRIGQTESLVEPGRKRAVIYAAVAAAATILLLSTFVLTQWNKPWKEYSVPYGETRRITLPDGSSVVLNANSTLTLKSPWDTTKPRDLWIEGEAYFDVQHKKNDQRFVVHAAQGVRVEVLGTTFNVYNRVEETKVVLNTGQIRMNIPVEQSAEAITMKPGEMVEYKAKRYSKRDVNPLLYTAWTTNKIILDHTSLAEMVQMLRDTYGLTVDIPDTKLLAETVSGSMPHGNADALLKQLAMAYRVKMTRNGNYVKIEAFMQE